MMSHKVFAEKGQVQLRSDTRDIQVASQHRNAVWDWCYDNGITVEYQGTLYRTDVWRVRDPQHRMWFQLRWS